jgi:hypothetical protein
MALPKTGDSFLDQYAQDAIDSQRETGVPASVTLAQALIESNRGKSGLTVKAKNFFGIKGKGNAGSIKMRTREVNKQGQSYYIMDDFAAYHSAKDSFIDHGKFFIRNKRYAKALAVKHDAKQFAREIQKAGYATDPRYAATLISIIDKYNLTRFDELAGLPTEEEIDNLLLLPTLMLKSPMMRDAAVKSLQMRLNALMPNLKLKEDGIFGRDTDRALRVFQAVEKLKADGICGVNCWRRLMER